MSSLPAYTLPTFLSVLPSSLLADLQLFTYVPGSDVSLISDVVNTYPRSIIWYLSHGVLVICMLSSASFFCHMSFCGLPQKSFPLWLSVLLLVLTIPLGLKRIYRCQGLFQAPPSLRLPTHHLPREPGDTLTPRAWVSQDRYRVTPWDAGAEEIGWRQTDRQHVVESTAWERRKKKQEEE